MPSRRQVLATLAASATAGIAGCSSNSGSSKKNSSTTVDDVTYLTGFGNTPREQYARVGDAKGYFEDANIKISVKPGQPSDFNVKALATGAAQFASIDFVSAITNAAAYPNFRVIAAIQDRTLLSVIAYKDGPISQPSDLPGKLIAAGGAKAAGKTLFKAYAKLAQVDDTKVKWQISTPDQLPGLLASNRVQAMTSYLIDQPTIKSALKGRDTTALAYADYLTDLYGTVVITTTDLIKKNPDLVKRFATAITKGSIYAVQNTDEAGQVIHKAFPANDATVSAAVMTLMKPYVKDGSLDSARVARGIATLEGLGVGKPGLTPDDIMASSDIIPKVTLG